MTVTPFAAR
jgi:hypothetical protein